MATCFVMQPFDSGKFDKRFDDIYKPAIEAAGLEAYRVDRDVSVSIPIEAIEEGIRRAAVCLADITADNPNVWYELGYAFALGRPVVMVCSEERSGIKYPFDIQHRSIISYSSDAPRDFQNLGIRITERLKSIVASGEILQSIADSDPTVSVEGLSHGEVIVLAVIAGSTFLPNNAVNLYLSKRDAERAGLTSLGFNLALRRLLSKRYVSLDQLWDEQAGEPDDGVSITDFGWSWIEENESRFVLHNKQDSRANSAIEFSF